MGGSLSQNRRASVSSPKKQNSFSDSEGNFETPEAESPVVVNLLGQMENSNNTDPTDDFSHFHDRCHGFSSAPSQQVDSLNNCAGSIPNNGSFGLDQNLNMTPGSKAGSGESLTPSSNLTQNAALRPPSLPVLSPLNKPDPSEVDDQAPVTCSSSPHTISQDDCLDPDLLNANIRSDSVLSNAKPGCESSSSIINNSCKLEKNQQMQKDLNGQDDHHATDEEKLAVTAVTKSEKEQTVQECYFTSKPDESDCGSMIITKEAETSDWKKKYEQYKQEVDEMRKIVAEYEKTIAQMIEDEQRNTGNFQKALHAVMVEKDAALADLNSVERSLSDIFRRYENMKSTLEGFKKNEEVLKKCAQDYLARVKQEEQRYQTLKQHAEEKLDKANEEIAQVRTKASSETTALTARLRKGQMRNDSLEQALQQKNQEIEELSKICDELIAKMGRVD